MSELNARIHLIRAERKLTRKQFSERIGCDMSSLSRYESGDRIPSNAVLIAICNSFQVNKSWLLTGEGPIWKDESSEESIIKVEKMMDSLPDRLKQLMLALAEMDPEWWKTLDEAIERMKQEGI